MLAVLVTAFVVAPWLFSLSGARATQNPPGNVAFGFLVGDTTLDPASHAAWTIVTSTILNLDETITKG